MDKIYNYINKNKWVEWVLFLGVFWLFIVHLHLNRGLDDMIPGYHYWRKLDTYSQILNYYHNGLNFFDHSIYFNQMESGGKAVAEFPLFYYFIAIQLKIFGNHDVILKINWLIVLCLGMFSLFKIALHYTKNHLLSLIVPLSLFLSPVFTVYCIEYLPDPIAMSFSFMGLYFLIRYFDKGKSVALVAALILISVSGLMKPFYLIPYIAFFIVFLGRKLLKREDILKYWFLVIPFVLIPLWFYYAGWYNSKVNSDYFLAASRPYWSIKPNILEQTNAKINDKWWPDYFHPTGLWTIIVLLAFSLAFLVKKNRKALAYLVFSLLGCVSFIILFYGMLKDHDYYIFPVLFIVPLIVLISLWLLSEFKRPKISYFIGGLAIALLYFSVSYSWEIRQGRLKSHLVNATDQFRNYIDLSPFLERNGISENDLIIAWSDKSPSYALSLLNRKGWSGFQTFYERMQVSELMDMGAQYMVVNESLPLKRDSVSLEGINMTYLADTNQIYLYKLSK